MHHLISIANAGMLMTFFHMVNKRLFSATLTVALNKRLISAPVHAGTFPFEAWSPEEFLF